MKRYKQRFNGMGTMFECETGEWCKYKEFEDILKDNEDALFGVIEERNETIDYLRKTCQELGDDNEESKLWNTKLFSLLVMSTVFNFGAIAFFVFERLGMI
jgi:hypothetical protein